VALDPSSKQTNLTPRARIIGISLVRNEDLFVETAIANASLFCDELYIADHGSTDQTGAILAKLATSKTNIHLRTVRHPSQSHDLIRDFAGSRTWIFGVDGDEIYEPDRLARLREKIVSGVFDQHWMVFGNVLHVTKLDEQRRIATGHLAPPCRSMTKLYNFNAIEEWKGYTPERLHGGTISFRPGYSRDRRRMLHEEVSWGEADFRCLHLCFLKRSSRDREDSVRRNIIETFGPTRLHTLWYAVSGLIGLRKRAEWKRSRYMRGPETTVAAETFFPTMA
jgi:glycosyltransferase involved in cell wall biosynthesis